MGDVEAAKSTEGERGGFLVAAFDEVPGRLGEEEETQGEDTGPAELEAHGDAVGGGSVDGLGQDVDDGGDEQAKRDG